MAFTLPRFSLQSITSIARAIRIVNNSIILPIIFTADSEESQWEVPRHPVDSNMQISDTIWATPAHLQLDGFVSIRSYPLVLQLIDSSLKSNQLWTVYYMGGVYRNMAIVSLSKTSSSDNASSYPVKIEVQQIPVVTPLVSAITAEQAKLVQDTDTALLGQTQAQQSSNSSLLYQSREYINNNGGIGGIIGGIF